MQLSKRVRELFSRRLRREVVTDPDNPRDFARDSVELTDPGPRGGPLGAADEMPEGGDSTRFPQELKKHPKRRAS